MFLADLNKLETWTIGIGNAYLEDERSEKVYIIAGPEFLQGEGATLVIFQALYVLKSSGKLFHENVSDDLRDIGFSPYKNELDIRMRKVSTIWKYVAVGNLCLLS